MKQQRSGLVEETTNRCAWQDETVVILCACSTAQRLLCTLTQRFLVFVSQNVAYGRTFATFALRAAARLGSVFRVHAFSSTVVLRLL